MGVESRALEQSRLVRVQPQSQQVIQDPLGAAGNLSRRINVFDADQPLAPNGLRLQITGQRGDERAEVQVPGRGGRKPADDARG